MKADNTRSTFNRKKHYNSVRMQQGRVQLDADWNEQMDIISHRVETETYDVVGLCGMPINNPGFHIVGSIADLTEKERKLPENQDPPNLLSAGDFYISGGRFYLEGILCQNEHIVPFSMQPDLPTAKPATKKGVYLAYLDVWSRHITALEDPEIQEKALGGPDTATRTKTIWQVNYIQVGDINAKLDCLSLLPDWNSLIEPKPSPGKLAARAEKSAKKDEPCILVPGAGFRRLENQLYRVEVHRSGVRGNATFKWSRDNGSIVAKWEEQDVNKLTVGNIGRDKVLNFAAGQWVELSDDTGELLGRPGTLVQLVKVEGQVLTIDAATIKDPDNPAATSVDIKKFHKNPKIRRWDSDGEIKLINSKWIDLEEGVQVRFSIGTYRTGDYWLIPARTATADVEWPQSENASPSEPLDIGPHGIQHRYCKLGLLKFDGSAWTSVQDCRRTFPRITELTSLFYVSGDGQEVTPKSSIVNELIPLDQSLKVGVANGSLPLSRINITFEVIAGIGRLSGNGQQGRKIGVWTGPEGIAECQWELDSETQSQQVIASLHEVEGKRIHLPVIFTANLSRATHVYYKPGACPLLANVNTVQEAIDELCLLGRSPGCCVTVSPSESLPKVIEGLKDKKAVRLCLLPGPHEIKEDIIVADKVWFEIFGCGADVRISCEKISIRAEFINLFNLKFHVENGKGQIRLAGKIITAERSLFIRSIGDRVTPPLVYIEPLEGQKVGAELCWRNNGMESFWEQTDSKRLGTFLIPRESVKISPDLRAKLGLLAGITRVKRKGPYAETAKLVAHEISTLSSAIRRSWVDSIPENVINALDPDSQNSVKKFIAEITKIRVSEAAVLAALGAVVGSFRRRFFNQSLALAGGVGGWIENNKIQGYLALHFDEKFKNLAWGPTNEAQQKNKDAFESKYGAQLISIDPESLVIRGNRILAVHSSGQTVIDLISSILSGAVPAFTPPPGYQCLHVGDNVFQENNGSFVAWSSILSGNQFSGAMNADDVGAYVWGKSGIFLGNVAPTDEARIEKILQRMNPQTNLTNLLQIA